jgi:hypothetical protein
MFCSRKCSGTWRRNNVYKDKYTNKWRASSPRKFLSSSLGKKKDRENLSLDYLMSLYDSQQGKCALSGREMTYITGQGRVPTNISIDKIDPLCGYVEGNVQLTCRQANIMKMELNANELTSWCEDIYNHLKGKK